MNAKDWVARFKFKGNGFQFGNRDTVQSTSVIKKTVYSVAFDNKYIGFHNNISQGCSGYIENCVSLQQL